MVLGKKLKWFISEQMYFQQVEKMDPILSPVPFHVLVKKLSIFKKNYKQFWTQSKRRDLFKLVAVDPKMKISNFLLSRTYSLDLTSDTSHQEQTIIYSRLQYSFLYPQSLAYAPGRSWRGGEEVEEEEGGW